MFQCKGRGLEVASICSETPLISHSSLCHLFSTFWATPGFYIETWNGLPLHNSFDEWEFAVLLGQMKLCAHCRPFWTTSHVQSIIHPIFGIEHERMDEYMDDNGCLLLGSAWVHTFALWPSPTQFLICSTTWPFTLKSWTQDFGRSKNAAQDCLNWNGYIKRRGEKTDIKKI